MEESLIFILRVLWKAVVAVGCLNNSAKKKVLETVCED